jgi:hypothetical protein
VRGTKGTGAASYNPAAAGRDHEVQVTGDDPPGTWRMPASLLLLQAVNHGTEHRSQLRNREAALERLAGILATALAPPPPARRPTRASRGSVERRLADKRRRAETKRLRKGGED